MALFETLSDDGYTIPKAQILFKESGGDTYEILGDADDVTLEMNVEETDRFTNEEGIRKLAKTIVTQIDPRLAMTLVHLSDRNRSLALLGLLEYVTQTAAPGETFNIVDAEHGGKLYKLPHIMLTNVVVEDGSAVPYVLNTNYRIDTDNGIIQLITPPLGADGDVVIDYDAAAVVAGDLKAKIKVGASTSTRGAMIIRGTNDVGKQVSLYLHDVQLRPSAGRAYISETDLATVEIEGRVFVDDTQPAGLELGYELANG